MVDDGDPHYEDSDLYLLRLTGVALRRHPELSDSQIAAIIHAESEIEVTEDDIGEQWVRLRRGEIADFERWRNPPH
jgi:hypothetical protein